MNHIVHPKILILVLGFAGLLSLATIAFAWQAANGEINQVYDDIVSETPSTTVAVAKEKPAKRVVKGVYLTAYSAGSTKKMDQIIDLLDKTELNSVVMDIKDYSGLILFDTKVPLAVQLKIKDNRYPDLRATIKKLHDHNIYVIARQTVFQDPALAKAKPDWAFKNTSGGIWRDNKGLSWVDGTKKEVWDYNVAIAKDAMSYGFDEVNFDYIRFPSDGNLKTLVYEGGKKYEIMERFYKYLTARLANDSAWLSFDMFGFVMEKKGFDDMNIGQRLDDALPFADYICPMMYPSHYPSGHLGLKNPAAAPAAVLNHGLKIGVPRFAGMKAELRPWIQAFNMGAVYDGSMIRAEIDTVEKYTNSGWLLWNAANRYTSAGLKAE